MSDPRTGRQTSEAEGKAALYGFLSRVLGGRPTEDGLARVAALAEALDMAPDVVPSIAELDAEYIDLFVVPGPRYVAPYESVYRDRLPLPERLRPGANPGEAGKVIKGLVMGECTMRVKALQVGAGVTPEHDLPDHIANELGFLAYLWSKDADRLDESRAAQMRDELCRHHLRKWLGQLRDKVKEVERLRFYGLVCDIVEAVLQHESSVTSEREILGAEIANAAAC